MASEGFKVEFWEIPSQKRVSRGVLFPGNVQKCVDVALGAMGGGDHG